MADIELVIKIPEEIRLALINDIKLSQDQKFISDSYISRAIINGIPLPKGHGRLIDADSIHMPFDICNGEEAIDYIYDAPTIIEADKEG